MRSAGIVPRPVLKFAVSEDWPIGRQLMRVCVFAFVFSRMNGKAVSVGRLTMGTWTAL